MATLKTLLSEVEDPKLRTDLEKEVKRLNDQQRFGLVYERHLPETVLVGDIDPLKVGDHVRPRNVADVNEDFRILEMNSRTATLLSLKTGAESRAPVRELLAVKRFGDRAFLGLESRAAADDDDLEGHG